MSESFTIQISTDLVNKLADEGERLKKKPKKPRKKSPQAPQQSLNRVHQKQISDALETKKGAPAAGWPFQPPIFLPASPPTQIPNEELDAIQTVLQESEKVVDRLQKQEDNMVQEVTQRAKELHEEEFKLPYQKPMPCLSERDACLQCYKEHANDPLKCAHVVKAFADCARKVRQQVVD